MDLNYTKIGKAFIDIGLGVWTRGYTLLSNGTTVYSDPIFRSCAGMSISTSSFASGANTGIVVKILETKKFATDKKYRLSRFVYIYFENDKFLIKNMMSGRVIQLTADEKLLLEKLKNEPQH